MKKIAFILLAFVFIVSCTKKDDEDISEIILETFELTSEQSSVKPLEFVILKSTEMNFSEQSYKATIGEIEIDLFKTENNNLIFSVPNLNPGSTKLELTINNKKGVITFKINENIVQNAEAVIEKELTKPLNDFQSDVSELLLDSSITIETRDQLSSAKKMIEDYMSNFNSLSNEEKMSVAEFFNSNPLFTSDYLNLSSKKLNGNPKYSSIKKSALKLVVVIGTVIVVAEVIAPLVAKGLAGLGTFLGVSTVGAAIIVTAVGAAAIIHAEHNKILNNAFLPFENVFKDNNGNYLDKNSKKTRTVSAGYEINNNTNYTFNVVSKDRLLNSSDINNANSDIAELVNKLNLLESKWNIFKNGVNSIVSSTTNWFTGWFSSSSSTYKPITYNFNGLPQTTNLIETNGNSEFITIEDFPSDVEVEYSVASNNSIKLKFKADESTLPRTITGKIKYDDGDFKNENEFSVKINDVEFDFVGTWMLSYYSASVNDGVDYLHQEERFTLDASGYSSTYEVKNPTNSPPNNDWRTFDEDVNISYSNGKIIINASAGFYVIVNNFDDTIFYSENWERNFTINDYYWKIKFEKI